MIVLDASTVVELLTGGALAESIRENLAARDDSLIAPHLLDIEVASAMSLLTDSVEKLASLKDENSLISAPFILATYSRCHTS